MNFTSPLILTVLIASAAAGLEVVASFTGPRIGHSTRHGMDAASTAESMVVVFPAMNQIKAIPGVLKTAPLPVAILRTKSGAPA